MYGTAAYADDPYSKGNFNEGPGHQCDYRDGEVTLAPTCREGSADSQVPIGGRPLPAFLRMVRFICVPSAVRDRRSLTHTRGVPWPNCTGMAWSWPRGGREPGSLSSCPHLTPSSQIFFSVSCLGSNPGACPPYSLRGLSPTSTGHEHK